MQHKLTVIIPTRERADTLYWAIKTCTIQDYDNLEIIVSDNFSQDDTRAVVAGFQDQRIRYINPGKRLNMSHHWEFALSHVSEGWVMILGDDDGLAKGGVKRVSQVIDETSHKVITWRLDMYTWPDYQGPVGANMLLVAKKTGYRIRDAKFYLDGWRDGTVFSQQLPSIYKGFIHVDIIKEVIYKSKSKRFFNSITPDVYSSVAICSVIENFVFLAESISLPGLSGHSTGVSFWNADKKRQQSSNNFLSEKNIPFHADLDVAPSMTIVVAEVMYQAVDQGLLSGEYKKSYQEIIHRSMKEASADNELSFNAVKNACVSMAGKHNIDSSAINAYKNKFEPKKIRFGYDLFRKSYKINGDEYGLKNIYEAVLFKEALLQKRTVMKFHIFDLITYNYSVLQEALVSRLRNHGVASILTYGLKSIVRLAKKQLN